MTSLVCLVFALYLNQISRLKMFPKSHLRTTRTRNWTNFQYIYVSHGHVLVPLHVLLRILQLVDHQGLVTTYSYKRPFHIVTFGIILILVLCPLVFPLYKLLLDVEYLPLVL